MRPLDPESKALLDIINALNLPLPNHIPLLFLRATFEEKIAYKSDAPIREVRDININGPHGKISTRIYLPEGSGPFPVLLNAHGGGWVVGNLNTHDAFCRELCSQASMVVVSINYSLAPEHKFPIALEECVAVAKWLQSHAAEIGGDPEQIIITGDSAGGNLIAALSIKARDEGWNTFKAQVLVYPVTNPDFETASYTRFADGHMVKRDAMKWYWDQYLRAPEDRKNPLAAPLLANLSNLPPTLVVLAEFDPLHDDGKLFADKLKASGVPTTLLSYPSIHGFAHMANKLSIGRQAIRDIAHFLNSEV
jgi:acetyl esterase